MSEFKSAEISSSSLILRFNESTTDFGIRTPKLLPHFFTVTNELIVCLNNVYTNNNYGLKLRGKSREKFAPKNPRQIQRGHFSGD